MKNVTSVRGKCVHNHRTNLICKSCAKEFALNGAYRCIFVNYDTHSEAFTLHCNV